MGVIGVGIDIIELERIDGSFNRFGSRFLSRILTPKEQNAVGSPPRIRSVAARFAAKEAVAKAMGTGIRGFSFLDIEVVNDELGAPRVVLHGAAKRIAAQRGIQAIRISMTHSRAYAAAVAVAEGGDACMS